MGSCLIRSTARCFSPHPRRRRSASRDGRRPGWPGGAFPRKGLTPRSISAAGLKAFEAGWRTTHSVILSASGTDTESLALAIASAVIARPITNIVVGSGETGRGVALAAAGQHFLSSAPFGGNYIPGIRIAGWEREDVVVETVEIRTPDGEPRPDARRVRQADARRAGRRCSLSAQDRLPSSLPDHDVAFVAVAESDENRPILECLAASAADWPRPLINDPGLIARLIAADAITSASRWSDKSHNGCGRPLAFPKRLPGFSSRGDVDRQFYRAGRGASPHARR